jgi:hypothetical protein
LGLRPLDRRTVRIEAPGAVGRLGCRGVDEPYDLASYSVRNQERILAACPHATEVRTFHGWLAGGRVVVKGQKGIRIVAPDEIDGGKITSIKAVYVFDVTQTQERTHRAAA